MPSVSLTQALGREYADLFSTCVIRSARANEVEKIIDRIKPNRGRYESVANTIGMPWYVVAVIHNMESSLNFTRHLHNGDPLTRRTTHVPAGRPQNGTPPFTWEESATDALRLRRLDRWNDWSIAGILYQLEGYNGWGYRRFHTHVLSPYLWSFSNHYTSGKYVADGTWSETAVSSQCGAAVLLRRMVEKGVIDLASQDAPSAPVSEGPLLRFGPTKRVPLIEGLQAYLNQLPGIFLNVDGKAGEKTSDAVRKVFGHYLEGDPREI